jgi:hypothetical protein
MVELLMAMSVMVLIGGVVAGLASAVYTANDYCQGVANATQHGRVALERIQQTVRTATASETFAGCAMLETVLDSYRVADTLVVWHPADGVPANASGPPLARELFIYAPDPSDARQLVEIIPSAGDARAMPLPSDDHAAWAIFINGLKSSGSSTKTVLTELLRVANVTSNTGSGPVTALRGGVQFECRAAPSAASWSAYRAGTVAWNALPWPQGLYGPRTGIRQVSVDVELQLMPRQTAAGHVSAASQVMPMFGSATLYYDLSK